MNFLIVILSWNLILAIFGPDFAYFYEIVLLLICSSQCCFLLQIAYFLEPSHDCLVECLPTCKSDSNPPKWVKDSWLHLKFWQLIVRRSYCHNQILSIHCGLFIWLMRILKIVVMVVVTLRSLKFHTNITDVVAGEWSLNLWNHNILAAIAIANHILKGSSLMLSPI